MSDTADRVRVIMIEVFDLDPMELPAEMDVDNIAAWDSLGHLELIARLEADFGIGISHSEAVQLLSETAIVKAISARRE